MSQATKRKHVAREVLEERVEPSPRQRIVRVLGTPGNNLHQVETPEGSRFLVTMPSRFRRHIWIKRGDFLLVDPIEEGDKVKAEMQLLLLPPHVRWLQHRGLWPEAFAPPDTRKSREDEDGDEQLFVNTNRAGAGDTGDTEDSGDTEDTEDSGDTEDTEDSGDEDTGDPKDTEDAGDQEHKDTGDNSGDVQATRCP